MRSDVKHLVGDSGELLAASGLLTSAGQWRRIMLLFRTGTLQLTCDDDTDELIVVVGDPSVETTDTVSLLSSLVGMTVTDAWELRNHRGYVDGFQLRLVDARGHVESRQFEAAASAIDVWTVDSR